MARPRFDPKSPKTTDRLLGAAERAFGRLGFTGARLEDIARSVGISRPSLLYHFGSKEKLYRQVVGRAFKQLREKVEAAIQKPRDFVELIDNTLDAWQEFLEQHPALASVLLREILQGRGPGTRTILREMVALVDWIEEIFARAGRDILDREFPVRAAILQVGTASLVQHTAPRPVRTPLWGTTDHTRTLARQLFLGSTP